MQTLIDVHNKSNIEVLLPMVVSFLQFDCFVVRNVNDII